MKKSFIIIWLFIGHFFDFSAQEEHKIPRQIRGFMAGVSFSKLYFEGKRQQSAFSFGTVGINTEFDLNKEHWSLGSSLLISNQKSYLTPSILVKQQVAQLLIGPQLKLDDVKFITGLSLEYRNSATLRSITESSFTLQEGSGDPSVELKILLGTEFLLSQNFSMVINGIIPTQSSNSSSFQLGLKYRFHAKKEKVESYRFHREVAAKNDILKLKQGALLVRLKTSQSKITALRKAGKDKQADKAEKWQKSQNEKIMAAFKNRFDFAPVYFFYSDNSNKIREGDFEGIFLNEKLEVDSMIIMNKEFVYTAEYAAIKQDTLVQFSHNELEQIGDFRSAWIPRYYGQPNMGFKAIVLNNQSFEQLCEPFPYYARTNAPGIQKHPEQLLFGFPLIYFICNPSYDAAVEALNSKLTKFYGKSQ